MARPSFKVHNLIFCTSVEFPNAQRPQRNSTLNGVDFVLEMPPGTEFPFAPDEFWLYARFYSVSDQPGISRPLTITCFWLDVPGGQKIEVWRRTIGPQRFLHPNEVLDRAWAFRNFSDEVRYPFPGLGRYEFQIWHPIRKWPHQRIKAREFIRVEM